MKNFPYQFMKGHAKKIGWIKAHIILVYEDERSPLHFWEALQASTCQQKNYEKSTKHIWLDSQYVIKRENRAFYKRWAHLYGGFKSDVGHRGVVGEALNTLVANEMGIPSHLLCAVMINPFTGAASAVYERIVDKAPAAQVLRETGSEQRAPLIKNILRFLASNVRRGLYFHPECHPEHIFIDADACHPQLIDFERAIKADCSETQLFVVMASRLYRDPLPQMMSPSQFQQLLREVATEEHLKGDVDLMVEKMKQLQALPKNQQSGRKFNALVAGKETSVIALLEKTG